MKYLYPSTLLVLGTLFITGSTIARPQNQPPAANGNVQVIEVTAKKYEFNPSPIRVKQGAKIQLKITARDHAHGFRISPYPEGAEGAQKAGLVFSSPEDCVKIEKGQTATIEFVAQTTGTYPFKCCVHCGWRHRSMTGKLIVEP
jgi:heme/copper-type cytochrome/quinol oxidase subunit 2